MAIRIEGGTSAFCTCSVLKDDSSSRAGYSHDVYMVDKSGEGKRQSRTINTSRVVKKGEGVDHGLRGGTRFCVSKSATSKAANRAEVKASRRSEESTWYSDSFRWVNAEILINTASHRIISRLLPNPPGWGCCYLSFAEDSKARTSVAL